MLQKYPDCAQRALRPCTRTPGPANSTLSLPDLGCRLLVALELAFPLVAPTDAAFLPVIFFLPFSTDFSYHYHSLLHNSIACSRALPGSWTSSIPSRLRPEVLHVWCPAPPLGRHVHLLSLQLPRLSSSLVMLSILQCVHAHPLLSSPKLHSVIRPVQV